MTFSFTIPRTDFLAAVDRADKVVGKSDIPITNNLRLDLADDGTLTVTGTDMQRKAIATATTTHQVGAGATTLSASHLIASLRRSKGDTVKVAVGEKDAKVQIGRSNLKMPTLPASDFPDIDAGASDITTTFQLPGSAIERIVKACSFAMEKSDTRAYLMGIHLRAQDDRLVAASTDGKRVARATFILPEGAADMPAVTLPDTLVAILTLFAKVETVAVSVAPTLVSMSAPGLRVVSRLLDGNYPDINRYIPARRGAGSVVDREGAIEALRLVESFSGSANRDVALAFKPDGLRLMAASMAAGEAVDEMSADGNADLVIGFKSEFLIAALASMEGASVEFDFGTANDPAVIYDPADDTRLVMMMPFTLSPAIAETVREAA